MKILHLSHEDLELLGEVFKYAFTHLTTARMQHHQNLELFCYLENQSHKILAFQQSIFEPALKTLELQEELAILAQENSDYNNLDTLIRHCKRYAFSAETSQLSAMLYFAANLIEHNKDILKIPKD